MMCKAQAIVGYPMNWEIYKTEEQPFIRVVADGVFNLADHLKMLEGIISNEFWDSCKNVLLDYRNMEFGSADITTARATIANYKIYDEHLKDCLMAFLMGSLVDYGRGRQLQLLAAGNLSIKTNIFLDETEAVAWLTSLSDI